MISPIEYVLQVHLRESIRIWVHRFSSSFKPSKRARRLVAVHETVLRVKGQIFPSAKGGIEFLWR
jgi:transposase-like protein